MRRARRRQGGVLGGKSVMDDFWARRAEPQLGFTGGSPRRHLRLRHRGRHRRRTDPHRQERLRRIRALVRRPQQRPGEVLGKSDPFRSSTRHAASPLPIFLQWARWCWEQLCRTWNWHPTMSPTTPPFLAKEVVAGAKHSCAITTGDEPKLYCWGKNDQGQANVALGVLAYHRPTSVGENEL